MKKAGLVETVKRGVYKITIEGLKVLKEKPKEINNAFLSKYQSFIDFQGREKTDDSETTEIAAKETRTPEEIVESTYKEINKDLAEDLLDKIKESTPQFFEKLVVEVLVAMGYGGSREDAGQAIGKRGDEGIDGIIKEDKLGLDIIYIQAKKWDSSVGRPEIQKFAGALQGQRAKKGIFITTANFSKEAKDFVKNIDAKIILIDGEELAGLMISNNVGVSAVSSYEIKKVDMDYFED
jgi:restriction system protein